MFEVSPSSHQIGAVNTKNDSTWVFDLAGTLFELSPARELIFQKVLARHGVFLSEFFLGQTLAFVDNYHLFSELQLTDRRSQRIEYNKKILNYLSISDSTIAIDLFEEFEKTNAVWVPVPGMLELLSELKLRGVVVGVATNFSADANSLLADIRHSLDFVVISSEVGVEKPSRKFFEMVLEKVKRHPGDALFIGDSFILDYIPSRLCGMRSILIDRFDLLGPEVQTVRSIRELMPA